MKRKNYRRFNLLLMPLVAFNLLSIALFNLAVDPYGILNSLNKSDVQQSELESEKPSPLPTPPPKAVNKPVVKSTPQMTLTQRSKYRAERFKLNLARLSISRINPKTILLGTSTALRLSPQHPALTRQPAYNLGLPGAKMHDIRSYFEDILANHPDLKEVVIGLDFYSFGGAENQITPQKAIAQVNPITPENTIKPTTEVRKNKYSISLEELVIINFSLDTLIASLKKVMANYIQSKPIGGNKPHLTDRPSTQSSYEIYKFNSLHRHFNLDVKKDVNRDVKKAANKQVKLATKKELKKQGKLAIKKDANKLIKQPINKITIKQVRKDYYTTYNNNPKLTIFRKVIKLYWTEKTFYKSYHLSKEELNDLKEIIDKCKQRNITIKVFFSPVHAAQLEAIHTAGLWSAFEEWKRQVIEITPAWDFSDYSSITTEPINDNMENFVDSVHYQNQIGVLILNRLYNYHKERVPSNFGLLITPANIESHLTKIRDQRQAWLKTNPPAVKFVQDIKKERNEP